MTHRTEVSLKIPNLEDLCCVNCKVIPSDQQDCIVKSLFHSQILTCRLIIYSIRCCVASPSIQNVGDSVHVIISRKFFTTGKLQEHLNELKIKFSDPEEVHPKIYEACLKYTFTFKIAPHWNLIGTSLYLRGSNFLPFPPVIDAIDWNVHYKDDNIKLELKPMKLNIQCLTLEFLKLPPSILDNFISNPNCTIDTINLTLFPCPWVYVLPKLTRARLISVSRTLPEKCSFDTYNDLRRHWKNMYSYRLPKTSNGMLFYEVVFPSYPIEPYIYPEACLLSRTPEFVTCENKNEIASEFLKDLAKNVHAVCGEVIHIGHIYPTLNIEYSCSIKNKYGKEYEEILNKYKSPFFNAPSECIIIPSDSKPNMPSIITVNGIDKMKTPMRTHTQKVLSMMNPRKENKKPAKKKNQYYSQMPTKCKNKMFDTQKFNQNTPPEIDEPTVIDNIDDIISYYDIPSMYVKRSENSESKNENENISEKNKENGTNSNSKNVPATVESQAAYSKPIIKNVENVHFNISAIKKSKIKKESNRQKDNSKKVKTDQFKKNTFSPNSVAYTPNSFEKIKETFFPSQKSKPHYDGFREFDFKSDIEAYRKSQLEAADSKSQMNENFQRESNDDIHKELADFDKYNLINENNTKIERTISNQSNKIPFSFESAKKQGEKLSRIKNDVSSHGVSQPHPIDLISEMNENFQKETNDSIRQELADFDKYNSISRRNRKIERTLSDQGNKLPFSFESAKKQDKKLSGIKNEKYGEKYFKLDDSYKISQQSKFHQLNEEFNSSKNFDSSLNLSPSLLECTNNFKVQTVDHETLKALLREEDSPENDEPCKSDTDNDGEKLQCSPSFLEAVTKYFDSPEHDNQMDFEESDHSIKTYTRITPKENMTQKHESTKVDQTSDNFSIYRNPDNSYNISPISTSNTEMFEESVNRKLLQTCKSPLSIFSKNEFMENNFSEHFKSEKEDILNNQQYSPSVFEKYESQKKSHESSQYSQSHKSYCNRNVQDKKLVKSHENQDAPAMEVDNSDFLSILSESSNESNSAKYESYQQACTEALTFN